MAIALDGFDVLRRIGGARQTFAAARTEADKAARAIVVKCLKATSLDLDGLRRLNESLGGDALALIAHELKASETLALLKRLDRHDAGLKTATPAARAQHLVALAGGEIEPAAAPAKAKTSSPRTRAPKRIDSALMTAFARGGRPDDDQDD